MLLTLVLKGVNLKLKVIDNFLIKEQHENIYKELDEKIMLGMRLKEGVNIYKLINEQNWDTKNSEIALKKLLKEWERFLES